MRRRPGTGVRTLGERPTAAPAATRQRTARLSDLRLWTGVLLLVGSTAMGALLLSRGEDTVTVLRATRDLAAGTIPTGLESVEVSRTVAGDHYAPAGALVEGRLRWPIPRGGLVPVAALDASPSLPSRLVTVPVDPLHAPMALLAGDVVDVWSMPRPDAAADAADRPELVLAAAVVASADEGAVGLGGEVGVVLEVPVDLVPAVVAATRRGVVDLVAVPATGPGATS
jgi:hypothetical protein